MSHDTHTLREGLVKEFGKHFPMEFFAHSSFNVMEPGVREWQFKAWQEKETSIALARRERVLNALRTALTTYGDAREAAAREEGAEYNYPANTQA